jgi:hypothetical protein
LVQRDLLIEICHKRVLAVHPRELHRRAGSSNRIREFAVLRVRGCQGAQNKGVRASDQSIGLFRKLNRLQTISQ